MHAINNCARENKKGKTASDKLEIPKMTKNYS